jgi:hypothetical protein
VLDLAASWLERGRPHIPRETLGAGVEEVGAHTVDPVQAREFQIRKDEEEARCHGGKKVEITRAAHGFGHGRSTRGCRREVEDDRGRVGVWRSDSVVAANLAWRNLFLPKFLPGRCTRSCPQAPIHAGVSGSVW